jgi:endonuclease III
MTAARRGTPPLPRKTDAQRSRAAEIHAALRERYPDARCELDYATPHELLVATILSAQSTDVGVNKATPALFKAFPTPRALADAGAGRIEPLVSSLNFFRNKAKAIAESMRTIVERHGGEVPRTMDELLALRGVARKTANVVLGNAFDIPEGVVVDTHVGRLSKRLGLTRHDDPAKVERDLMALFPQEQWTLLSHLLIFHGRRVCKARGGCCADDAICRRFCSNAKASSRHATASEATRPRAASPRGETSPTSRPPRRSRRTR